MPAFYDRTSALKPIRFYEKNFPEYYMHMHQPTLQINATRILNASSPTMSEEQAKMPPHEAKKSIEKSIKTTTKFYNDIGRAADEQLKDGWVPRELRQ